MLFFRKLKVAGLVTLIFIMDQSMVAINSENQVNAGHWFDMNFVDLNNYCQET